LPARADPAVDALTAPPAARSYRPWRGLAAAITLLTIVPVPGFVAGAELSAAPVWFPLVGAAVGGLAGGVRVLCGPLLGDTVATVLAMIALVIVTGALHQDGLADTADGLGVRGARARRLEVMRDSATGVFGALALISWALLLATTLNSLDADRALRALVVACALARWAALVHAVATPAARPDGLGAGLRVGRYAFAAATVLAVAIALLVGGLGPGAVAVAASVLVAAASAVFARRTLGGRTGDTLGATVAVAEVVVCVSLLAVWHG
jgi:adenosylcobinamide-GDP ribazoletransferase